MTSLDRFEDPKPLVRRFPVPGPQVQLAFRELEIAEVGTDEQKKALGPIADLARPWSPGTCTAPQMRAELWIWLDEVVVWLNHQMVFDVADVIPACWTQHAHLVNELAVLADLRRRADRAVTSEPLEEWHRYALPAFLERMRHRIAEHCGEQHARVRPTAGRLSGHLEQGEVNSRRAAFAADVISCRNTSTAMTHSTGGPRLQIVDTNSGELYD